MEDLMNSRLAPSASRLARALFALFVPTALSFGGGCVAEVSDGSDPGTGEGQLQGETCEVDEARACVTDAGEEGTETCVEGEDGALAWSACEASSSASTPLVLAFDGGAVDFLPADDAAAAFDLTGGLLCVATDWPSARTPWLALDRDGNGRIDDGGELFGSASRLADGALAPNGFAALRELDSDHDGRITPADEAWARLSIWSDRDASRTSSAGELARVSDASLLSIDLDYRVDPRCDARRNCEIERARFRYLDASGTPREGAVIDVHLRHRSVGSALP
jgi:hypothetical protein